MWRRRTNQAPRCTPRHPQPQGFLRCTIDSCRRGSRRREHGSLSCPRSRRRRRRQRSSSTAPLHRACTQHPIGGSAAASRTRHSSARHGAARVQRTRFSAQRRPSRTHTASRASEFCRQRRTSALPRRSRAAPRDRTHACAQCGSTIRDSLASPPSCTSSSPPQRASLAPLSSQVASQQPRQRLRPRSRRRDVSQQTLPRTSQRSLPPRHSSPPPPPTLLRLLLPPPPLSPLPPSLLHHPDPPCAPAHPPPRRDRSPLALPIRCQTRTARRRARPGGGRARMREGTLARDTAPPCTATRRRRAPRRGRTTDTPPCGCGRWTHRCRTPRRY